ncbi:MAG: biofilm PGA synthesis N-glycosyltransferase PgaC [Parcubacteria bacterium C7867-006]|nr:MAG: biofilm PGA synthesis N-glycosyltransferase PgaC [Parcubacteria bacterium C7867-006]
MPDFTNLVTYVFLFASLNFEVFLLMTYFQNKENMKKEEELVAQGVKKYPTVTIIVPCWNEEKTVGKTIHSLLNLDYPKDKLKIMIVDDGSTDKTWEVIQKFKNNPQIEIHTKPNGGKYTALNYGLSKLTTDLVGCLDADSYVHKDTLKKIVYYFQDRETMAVAPSIKLWEPKSILQLLQKIEYGFGIFTRKMFQYMNAIYITPGPFSIFRKEVFEKLGPYRHAHNTEDIEIALRMQENGFKIVHAHNAFVYTVPPNTVKKLLKQRIRWSHGFIQNAKDYRHMFFRKKYGNVGMLILPMAAISIISVVFISSVSIFNIIRSAINQYVIFRTVGFNPHWPNWNFDLFYVNTQILTLLGLATAIGTITFVVISKKMSEGKLDIGMDLIYYLSLYMFIAPIWIIKAAFNAIFKVDTKWR